ncbi:MAG: hypothetical protein IKO40_09910, partial [Kiritimatiellae bacterium]|nr:hypothetical protein [Kiritimatiellia bacterium]
TGRSMNATAVAALADSFGEKHHGPKKYADFSQFVGTMSDEEYERVSKIIEESSEQVMVDENKPWLYAAEDAE